MVAERNLESLLIFFPGLLYFTLFLNLPSTLMLICVMFLKQAAGALLTLILSLHLLFPLPRMQELFISSHL